MPKLTAEEINARIDAAAKKRPKIEKIDNSELLASSGLRVTHVHSMVGGHITVAYRYPGKNRRVLEISTAICHKSDTFSRKVGTKTAIEHFLEGHTIRIPTGNFGPVGAVRFYFGTRYFG